MGDPAGIGPEVVAKACAMRAVHRQCRPLVIGSKPVMERAVRALKLPLTVTAVTDHESISWRPSVMPVLDPLDRPLPSFKIGTVGEATGAASVAFIKKAVELAELGCIGAMVTGPINKEAMNLAGYAYPGHTELLAELTKSPEVGMMILGGPLKIMFVTTHVAIKDLPARLTVERIERAIRLAHRALRELFGIAKPRIGVAALNPHAGEAGLFGDEEQTTILPAAEAARRSGIQASNPLPADTLFGKAAKGVIAGFGATSYLLAIEAAHLHAQES